MLTENETKYEALDGYELGANKSSKDIRDYVATATMNGNDVYPNEFELDNAFMPGIKDQGNVSSCVAHVLAEVVEYYNRKQNGIKSEMSTGYIYGNRTIYQSDSKGMCVRDALKTLMTYGDVLKSEYPWNDEVPMAIATYNKLGPTMKDESYPSRISSYFRLNDEESIKAHLISGNPVVAVIPIYKNMTCGFLTGLISKNTGSLRGYHAVLIYGWNDCGWTIQNSWGYVWGKFGRGIYPYEFELTEAWGVTDDIVETNIKVKKPFINKKTLAKIINFILNLFIRKE